MLSIHSVTSFSQEDIDNSSPWVIAGVLSGVGVLWGAPGVGKSFVAMSMAASVAAGRPWIGRETQAGRVVYVAGEGGLAAVRRRLRAALREWRIDHEEEVIALDVVTPGPDLVEGWEKLVTVIGEPPPKLLVIDTLSRCFVGDENKQEYMGRFVRSLDAMRTLYGDGTAILVLHHTNKLGKIRGSTVLGGAVDVSWQLTRQRGPRGPDGRGLVMDADKLRERDVEGAQVHLRAVSVETGQRDEVGDKLTTLIIKPPKALLKAAEDIRDVGVGLIAAQGRLEYPAWRACFPRLGKAEFDAALSLILTWPGQWGAIGQVAPGVFGKVAETFFEPQPDWS